MNRRRFVQSLPFLAGISSLQNALAASGEKTATPLEKSLPLAEQMPMEGWTFHVSPVLIEAHADATKSALELIRNQLRVINQIMPETPRIALHKIPIWLSPTYDNKPSAEYHPSAGWLRDNGRNPDMAESVEISNVLVFDKENRRMPMLLLHELAHGYHHTTLGHEHPVILNAYQKALDSKRYESVRRWTGTKFVEGSRAYALTNHKEYFAETTEAYFGRNDFEPFTAEELAKFDPDGFAMAREIWGEPLS